MFSDPPLALEPELASRNRTKYGVFDSLALVVNYNFASTDYVNDRPVPELRKTILHETTHLYQMVATPYGYYYSSLRALQSNQVKVMLYLLKERHGLKLRVPLSDLILRLRPMEHYRDLRQELYVWHLAEVVLLYLEGSADLFADQMVLNPAFKQRSISQLFVETEYYLAQLFRNEGRGFPYSGPHFGQPDDSIEATAYALKLLMPASDALAALESAAKAAEYWVDDSAQAIDCGHLPSTFDNYYAWINRARSIFRGSSREFFLTYSALCDLALSGPLLPQHAHLRESSTRGIFDLAPVQRLQSGIGALSQIRPISDFSTDYDRFASDLVEVTGWPDPVELAEDTLDTLPPIDRPNLDFHTRLYHLANQFRTKRPEAFVDLGLWLNPRTEDDRLFIYYFVHPIIQFHDRILYHRSKDLLVYFILNYVQSSYLRRVLLSKDLTVQMPYRAGDDELQLYTTLLGESLQQSGVDQPRITLRPGT